MTSWAALGGVLALLVAGRLGFPVPEDVTLVGGGLLARRGSMPLWQMIHAEHRLVLAGLVAIAFCWALRVAVGRSA